MHLSTCCEWLDFLSDNYPKEIQLGLTRVKKVAHRLNLLQKNTFIITIGGTNGKGSTVTALESIYLTQGFKVGAFLSPMFAVFNDQIHVNGQHVSDAEICAAFAKIHAATKEVRLTPFEYHTLAALMIFQREPLDVILLEVGLGGRLDAVNVVDADLSIITTIAMDHMDRLGNTREAIAYEKAGIARKNHPLVCGDWDAPLSLRQSSERIGAKLYQQGMDFSYQEHAEHWDWQFGDMQKSQLPYNRLATQNMSTALMAVTLLQKSLPVTEENIRKGLIAANVPGRIQIIEMEPLHILDVAHNPASVMHLKHYLQKHPIKGKNMAVFSMLADKAIAESIACIQEEIAAWFVAALSVKRAANRNLLQAAFQQQNLAAHFFTDITAAYYHAYDACDKNDRLLIFGSFHTVSNVLKILNARAQAPTS